MTRKRAILIGLLTALGLALLAFYWRSEIIGWWNHESRYRGKYTNHWRSELRDCDIFVRGATHDGACISGSLAGSSRQVEIVRRSSVWSELLSKVGLTSAPSYPTSDVPPVLNGDPDALPTLLELLKDGDPHRRALAVYGIGKIGTPQALPAVPYLKEAANDPNSQVKYEVQWARYNLGAEEPTIIWWTLEKP